MWLGLWYTCAMSVQLKQREVEGGRMSTRAALKRWFQGRAGEAPNMSFDTGNLVRQLDKIPGLKRQAAQLSQDVYNLQRALMQASRHAGKGMYFPRGNPLPEIRADLEQALKSAEDLEKLLGETESLAQAMAREL